MAATFSKACHANGSAAVLSISEATRSPSLLLESRLLESKSSSGKQVFCWKDARFPCGCATADATGFGDGRGEFDDRNSAAFRSLSEAGRSGLNSDQNNVRSVLKFGLQKWCTARYG
jgi:hypothetical protein